MTRAARFVASAQSRDDRTSSDLLTSCPAGPVYSPESRGNGWSQRVRAAASRTTDLVPAVDELRRSAGRLDALLNP